MSSTPEMLVGSTTAFARRLGRARLPDELIEVLQRLGVDGVVLDATLPAETFSELARRLAARRGDLPVWALECPCPHTRASNADLAATDRGESDAATVAAEATIARAAELSADLVVVQLGQVKSLERDWPAVRRAHLRGELADDASGRERYLRARAVGVAPHLDAAHRALDRLGRAAENAGVRLGLRNPPRVLGLPSPSELQPLFARLAGAPIVPVLDLAAAHLDQAMGFRPVTEVTDAWSASPLALIADACGPVIGLPPGRGEIDVAAAVARLGDANRLVFGNAPSLTVEELIEAVAALRVLGGSASAARGAPQPQPRPR